MHAYRDVHAYRGMVVQRAPSSYLPITFLTAGMKHTWAPGWRQASACRARAACGVAGWLGPAFSSAISLPAPPSSTT